MTHCLKFKIQVFSVLGRLWFKCKKLKQKMWLLKFGFVTLCLLAAVTRCEDSNHNQQTPGKKQTGDTPKSVKKQSEVPEKPDNTPKEKSPITGKFFRGLLM